MVTDQETRNKIYGHYQRAQGSIQDIARVYRVSVDDVLEIIGAPQLGKVMTQGDLIDASEAGVGAEMSYGKEFKVPFSTD